MTTYEDIRATILEYHQSRHILTGAASSSQGPAPMDIGGLKGKKSFGKGGLGHFKRKKGKGKGKNPPVNFHACSNGKKAKVKVRKKESRNFVVSMLSWSVVPTPVEKATSLAAPAAPEPKATSGAAVSAVTLEPVPSSKAKAKAISKAPAKASGLALAAVTLGSMFAGTSFCLVVSPCHDVSHGCMLEGCVLTLMTFRLRFRALIRRCTCRPGSPGSCLLWCITCLIKTNLEMKQTCCIPRLWKIGDLGTWTQGSLIPTWQIGRA